VVDKSVSTLSTPRKWCSPKPMAWLWWTSLPRGW
jgi:hypothetical protein